MFQTAYNLQHYNYDGQICIGERLMCVVYKKLDGQDQVLEWWVRACQGINSSCSVVTTVMHRFHWHLIASFLLNSFSYLIIPPPCLIMPLPQKLLYAGNFILMTEW